jgi:glycosyltransferase involved in cell wall biosynthesis
MKAKAILDIRDKGVSGNGLKRFDCVIAASRSIADNVARYVPLTDLMMVPIPHAMLAPPIPPTDLPSQFFLFVGTIRHLKGVDVLLDSYRDYREAGGVIPLILIGPIVDSTFADEVGVMFLGPRSPNFVAGAMRQCALLLLPSRSEGLPHVCLEAIDLKIRFLVGPGIPELHEYCPGNVMREVTKDEILARLHHPEMVPVASGYDLTPHTPKLIAAQLAKLYEELRNETYSLPPDTAASEKKKQSAQF